MPERSAAGWRAYGPVQMRRASEIAALRALGFSLAEVARVLTGDAAQMGPALAAHQAMLETRVAELIAALDKVRALQGELAPKDMRGTEPALAFDLPWPWGGERFALDEIMPLTYITGPLGSGKTRFAMRLAETLPGAVFLGLERDGDLRALLEAEGPSAFVVDMVEQGLDAAAQRSLIVDLRLRGPDARPLFVMTRSSAILDPASVGAAETIIYCPANHSMPVVVPPRRGAPGYDAVVSCLAPPEVRARTAGVVAVRV